MLDGPFMVNQKHIQRFLTNDQIQEISNIVTDQSGFNLPTDELVDAIRLVLEDIPGIEIVSNQEIHHLTNLIRNSYNGHIKHQNQNSN
jgi:hypothetical protein